MSLSFFFLRACHLVPLRIYLFISPTIIIHTSASSPSVQPSSPGDYYSSVEGDLKVELTEKLFALDTDANEGPADTEVRVRVTLKQKLYRIFSCLKAGAFNSFTIQGLQLRAQFDLKGQTSKTIAANNMIYTLQQCFPRHFQ